ncbi:epoxide hydrolase family protein [Nonomuraea diastatica]|uniref:Epoxide hydrolase n=1 Tax=Nonomuraea diastatica TaxID=1848329 RepID=A0A4R4WBK2_9ACTN|nr:epoxide hydrolase family protein [Nonomuraea diastatica]TDD14497.1 epoxide hydrolase [Nonomuraea diastatica]
MSIAPFRIEIPQADLDDLRDRLARTRFTHEIPGTDHGVSVERVKRLVGQWLDGFDWRAQEARLNAHPQFTTEIDGQNIHFLHVRSDNPDALPLILTHGWPGSFLEYVKAIEPLKRHFHLVIPSLPGAGFSGPTSEPGWDITRIARAWAELMARLGYERYGVAGNDGGSTISPELGRVDPDHVVGVHVTQLYSFPSGDPAEFADLSEEEQRGLAVLDWFWKEKGAFNVLHSQQPQTIAHAIMDSPAGLLGWQAQILDEDLDDEFVLTNASIYWFTGTAGSSIRLYWENARMEQPKEPTTKPTALAMAEGDFASIRRFADRDHASIVSWKTLPAPAHGHYTAHSATEALTSDMIAFFEDLR